MGLWKGKKGSSVFYHIWNSNNKEKQGIREYRSEVKNPQSDGQADQRARLLPAQRIKGALRDIVSRSFQGIPYGAKSRLEFIRQAMRLKEGYPFVTKGYQEPVPGRYYISKGSLQQITTTDDGGAVKSNIALQIEIEQSTTIANFTAELLEKNSFMQEGDQLTIVACLCSLPQSPDVAVYRWLYYSVFLNSNDTTTFGDAGLMDYEVAIGSSAGLLTLTGDVDNIAASAIILSRKDEDGTYLRSTAQLAVADFMAPFFTTAQANITRASYQTRTAQNSTDWPVEEDTRGGGSSVTDGLYTLSGLTGNKATLNGQKVKVRINTLTGTPTAVYVLSGVLEGALVSENGGELTYQAGSELTPLTKSDVPALASLPSVSYS